MMRVALSFLICILLPLSLAADTIYLRNGSKVEGKIVGQSKFQVRIRTEKGTRSYSKSTIRRIVFGSTTKKTEPKTESAAEKKAQAERRRKAREARKKREAERKAAAEKKAARPKPVRRRPAPRRSSGNALLRSALIPGWGQSGQGRTSASYAFGGSFFTLFGLGIALELENRQLIAAANARQSELELMALVRGVSGDSLDLWQTLRLDNARERANNNIRLGNSVWTLTGLIYVANLIDVKINDGTSVGFAPGPNGADVVVRIRF